MRTILVSQKTASDGVLSINIPLGRPDEEFDVVLVVQPKSVAAGWPKDYFDLAGSIDDDSFVRHSQGSLPESVELD